MTEKRFKVDSMIKSFHIGEIADLETMQELIKEYGSSVKIELFITDNGKQMTYEEVETLLNELNNENKELQSFKQNVFDVIDNHIKECKERYLPFARQGKFFNQTARIVLEKLKKELSE